MVTTSDVTADVGPRIERTAHIESNVNELPTLERLDIEHVAVHVNPQMNIPFIDLLILVSTGRSAQMV